MSTEQAPLRVGDRLRADFLGGHFGRDGYGPARIEAIGSDWVVARDDRGRPMMATFDGGWTPDDLVRFRGEDDDDEG